MMVKPIDYCEMVLRGCTPFVAVGKIKRLVGTPLLLSSLILPDLGVGSVMGLHLLSGITLRMRYNNTKQKIREWWSLR